MPLSMVGIGETKTVLKINGKYDTRRILKNLGFVEGAELTVVSVLAGNMIVSIKDTRVAIDRSMSNRIMV